MKRTLVFFLITISHFNSVLGQRIASGDYGDGLKLSFDSTTNILTGYFENYTGSNEYLGKAKFSCVFYIEGIVTGEKFNIKTYFPSEIADSIVGTLEIIADTAIKIKLPYEHGGCWNVQHFADEPVNFTLEKRQGWKQVKYVKAEKAFFYADKIEKSRLKSYLVKNNFVCVQEKEGKWAYCVFVGKKTTTGWLKVAELNDL